MDKNFNEKKEVENLFRQRQEKLTYYIIALTVTSIGFSIYNTNNVPLSYTQIPLAIAIGCWGFSVFCGIQFLKYILSNLFAESSYYDIIAGHHPELGNDPEKIKNAIIGLTKATKINAERGQNYSKWHYRLFYSGIILFLLWHIIEMYKIT
ncbi:hypothetical protein [uncultured Christiangramia sp.]|uniref:hypothetical protein n=1 Tax=Christiangramia sp. 3-2217-3z TaxID=3417564 RepID=UPI002628EAF7|nr:hypothetical protein [uncultured Christiangramia sp.]